MNGPLPLLAVLPPRCCPRLDRNKTVILNGFAVLDAFVTVLRFLFGLGVVGLAVAVFRQGMVGASPEHSRSVEDRLNLLVLLALFLVGLNVASWPLFYLLLQSYVPEWPGVMCIYGVTQVGKGSVGASRFLPELLRALQGMKPALGFLSVAWLILYRLDRQTRTAPLRARVVGLIAACGLLSIADAAVEATYLFIPKKEEFLAAGCCTGAYLVDEHVGRFLPRAWLDERLYPWLQGAYFVLHGLLALGLTAATRHRSELLSRPWLGPLALLSLLAVPVTAAFVVEIAAPILLHQPEHHCVYDLVEKAPAAVLALALFVLGFFAVGWACVASWLGRCDETETLLPQEIARLLSVARFGYLGSVVLLSTNLLAAGWEHPLP